MWMLCNHPRRDLVADCVLAGRLDRAHSWEQVVATKIRLILVNQDIKAQDLLAMLLPLDTYALPSVNPGIDPLRRQGGLHRPCLHRSSPEVPEFVEVIVGACPVLQKISHSLTGWLFAMSHDQLESKQYRLQQPVLLASAAVIPDFRHRVRYSWSVLCMLVWSNLVLMVSINWFYTKTRPDVAFGANPLSGRWTSDRYQKLRQRCEGCGNRGFTNQDVTN